jgi:hypothetical protein
MGGFIVAFIQDYNVRVSSTTFHTRKVIPGKACNHS